MGMAAIFPEQPSLGRHGIERVTLFYVSPELRGSPSDMLYLRMNPQRTLFFGEQHSIWCFLRPCLLLLLSSVSLTILEFFRASWRRAVLYLCGSSNYSVNPSGSLILTVKNIVLPIHFSSIPTIGQRVLRLCLCVFPSASLRRASVCSFGTYNFDRCTSDDGK